MEKQKFAIHEETTNGGILNGDDQVGRSIHVVYFLSRKGRVEHPHLIRVHSSHCCNGVRLTDVKKWLSGVRGKDMPNSFSWSNKRRYKTGYIWQDLHDDDLITPISDNEYVLKGSEIPIASSPEAKRDAMIKLNVCPSVSANTHDHSSMDVGPEGNGTAFRVAGYESADDIRCESADKMPQDGHHLSAINSNSDNLNPFGVAAMEENSRTASARTIDSPSYSSATQTDDDDDNSMASKRAGKQEKARPKEWRSRSHEEIKEEVGVAPPEKKDAGEEERDRESVEGWDGRRKSRPSRRKRKGSSSACSGSAYSRFLKNLLNCRSVEIEDSAVKHVHVGNKSSFVRREGKDVSVPVNNISGQEISSAKLSTSNSSTGNQHANSNAWKCKQSSRKTRAGEGKKQNSGAAENHRRLPEPTCSQCGKKFNPEKLGSHMKSCKGLRMQYKDAAKQKMSQAANQREDMTKEEANGEGENCFEGPRIGA